EESTAAAHSMKAETGELAQLMAGFRTGASGAIGRTAPRAASAGAVARRSPARDIQRKVAASMGGRASEGWEEF
ncbi:MAG: hypothetical protein B7X99_16070, partial [Rhizobiales bacterium 17-65-6]